MYSLYSSRFLIGRAHTKKIEAIGFYGSWLVSISQEQENKLLVGFENSETKHKESIIIHCFMSEKNKILLAKSTPRIIIINEDINNQTLVQCYDLQLPLLSVTECCPPITLPVKFSRLYRTMILSADGKLLIWIDSNPENCIKMLDIAKSQSITSLPIPFDKTLEPSSLSIDINAERLLVTCGKQVIIWHIKTNSVISTIETAYQELHQGVLSADGRHMILIATVLMEGGGESPALMLYKADKLAERVFITGYGGMGGKIGQFFSEVFCYLYERSRLFKLGAEIGGEGLTFIRLDQVLSGNGRLKYKEADRPKVQQLCCVTAFALNEVTKTVFLGYSDGSVAVRQLA